MPWSAIVDMYNDELEKADAKGFSDLYKRCTDVFISHVEKLSGGNLHIRDLKYKDGYYLFATGTNSVVHFHIDECPGWLFGIWWSIEDDEGDDPKRANLQFFAQYESFIDKFKPSASVFSAECKLSTHPKKDSNINLGEIRDCYTLILYIKDEPALAFCRDQFYFDYNTMYVSRESAQSMMKEYLEKIDHQEKIEAELCSKLLRYYKDHILPLESTLKLVDRGKNWYPRYELTAPYSEFEDIAAEPGAYSLDILLRFADPSVEEGLHQKLKELDAIAEAEEVSWSRPIDPDILLYDDREGE